MSSTLLLFLGYVFCVEMGDVGGARGVFCCGGCLLFKYKISFAQFGQRQRGLGRSHLSLLLKSDENQPFFSSTLGGSFLWGCWR